MKLKVHPVRWSLLLLVVALFVPGPGCATGHYYRITDPATDTVYYTQNVHHVEDGDAVSFVDVRTGKKVTLDRLKIDALNKHDYERESGHAASQQW